ncbi:hypothetical protein WS72_03645 [Burkholderia savannae]|uniref:Uncharacterized protein n=1 Tax=Burkholderia savannae TaxID=1637837 RepID=A0ABR5TAP2_9BURK|nr:hypothetical protein WS72_03645 [Burkholderia savannae]
MLVLALAPARGSAASLETERRQTRVRIDVVLRRRGKLRACSARRPRAEQARTRRTRSRAARRRAARPLAFVD